MRRVALALCCLLALVGPVLAGNLSPRQFAAAYVEALAKAQPEAKATIAGELEVDIRFADGGTYKTYLDNAYGKYQQRPDELRSIIDTVVASLGETRSKASTMDRRRIVPVVKDRAWLASVGAALKSVDGQAQDKFRNVVDDLNDELIIVYAEDTPKNINYFSTADLERAGVARSELRALALGNLRRMIQNPEVRRGQHVGMIKIGGTYEASLLLLDEVWASLATAKGERVVAIPTRDVLLYTDSADAEGISILREAIAELAGDSPYRLSRKLFVRRNGRFVTYD